MQQEIQQALQGKPWWEVSLQAIVLFAGLATSLYKLMQHRSDSRAQLRTDLGVLKGLKSDDPSYQLVKAHIDSKIAKIYAPTAGQGVVRNWEDLIIGLVMLLGFGLWTAYLCRDGFSWWGLLTGFIALSGFTLIIDGFTKAPRAKKDQDAVQQQQQQPQQ
jgi:hypothetical protein